jgi:hypothetical protein
MTSGGSPIGTLYSIAPNRVVNKHSLSDVVTLSNINVPQGFVPESSVTHKLSQLFHICPLCIREYQNFVIFHGINVSII